MSIWKKIGGFLKKAAPVVGTVASFIPGIGPAISTGIKALAGAGGSDNAPTKDSSPEQYGLAPQSSQEPVQVSGASSASQWAPVVMGAVQGGLNYFGQKNTNVANAQQADKQMAFQDQMSSTSYQRGVADMKAAGLNPMLAYSQGGASAPGGAMATMGNEIGSGANSAMSAAQTMIQLQSAIAGIDKLNADTSVSEASAGLIRAQQRTELNRPENVIASTEFTKKGSEKSEAETRGQILQNEFLRESMEDRLKEISSGARLKQFMSESERLGLSEGRAMSNFWESAVGKASPYINLGTETVNSAVGAVSKALMPSAVRKGISMRRR